MCHQYSVYRKFKQLQIDIYLLLFLTDVHYTVYLSIIVVFFGALLFFRVNRPFIVIMFLIENIIICSPIYLLAQMAYSICVYT